MEKIRKKIVVVGDGGIGKTCLLTVFATNEFPEKHLPTIFDTYVKDIFVDEKPFSLVLSDTAGEEDYDRLRPLSYSKTDLVLICYSIDNPVSLDNVKLKWYPEIKHFLPNAYYFLVGTKQDRRHSKSISFHEGLRMSNRIRADRYMECSAKFSLGVRPIFEEAARLMLNPKKRGFLRECLIL
ncbi:rho-related GTP-binding protein RhoA-A-like [Dendroctonus ponderosae]|uniref:Uncharacterized protein n=1 Tax=Dendroctonus ponderosae TaxID=77166 RepID=J3JTZ3_DENPD|nr:rho-related GTP-binding protein RhoA-A-like [Dendroctonus ponderosae]AEE61665.1 unknown [Dendroctonus ponderosae]